MRENEYENMHIMEMPCSHCHLMHGHEEIPEELEKLYPRIYNIIYPHVKHHCHMMGMKHGVMHNPTKEDMDEMCERIFRDCEHELHGHLEGHEDNHHRQFGYGPGRFARDLITILAIRELLGGRPYYYGGYPYFGPPYYGPPYAY